MNSWVVLSLLSWPSHSCRRKSLRQSWSMWREEWIQRKHREYRSDGKYPSKYGLPYVCGPPFGQPTWFESSLHPTALSNRLQIESKVSISFLEFEKRHFSNDTDRKIPQRVRRTRRPIRMSTATQWIASNSISDIPTADIVWMRMEFLS